MRTKTKKRTTGLWRGVHNSCRQLLWAHSHSKRLHSFWLAPTIASYFQPIRLLDLTLSMCSVTGSLWIMDFWYNLDLPRLFSYQKERGFWGWEQEFPFHPKAVCKSAKKALRATCVQYSISGQNAWLLSYKWMSCFLLSYGWTCGVLLVVSKILLKNWQEWKNYWF